MRRTIIVKKKSTKCANTTTKKLSQPISLTQPQIIPIDLFVHPAKMASNISTIAIQRTNTQPITPLDHTNFKAISTHPTIMTQKLNNTCQIPSLHPLLHNTSHKAPCISYLRKTKRYTLTAICLI